MQSLFDKLIELIFRGQTTFCPGQDSSAFAAQIFPVALADVRGAPGLVEFSYAREKPRVTICNLDDLL